MDSFGRVLCQTICNALSWAIYIPLLFSLIKSVLDFLEKLCYFLRISSDYTNPHSYHNHQLAAGENIDSNKEKNCVNFNKLQL